MHFAVTLVDGVWVSLNDFIAAGATSASGNTSLSALVIRTVAAANKAAVTNLAVVRAIEMDAAKKAAIAALTAAQAAESIQYTLGNSTQLTIMLADIADWRDRATYALSALVPVQQYLVLHAGDDPGATNFQGVKYHTPVGLPITIPFQGTPGYTVADLPAIYCALYEQQQISAANYATNLAAVNAQYSDGPVTLVSEVAAAPEPAL